MDIPRDQFRRELDGSRRAHDDALPVYGQALDTAFDPDGPATAGERARLLGLPDRRGFFRIGGLTIAASAVLAACVNEPQNHISVQGTLPVTTTTEVPEFPGSEDLDKTLLLTAISIEWLAIDTYQQVLDNDWLDTQLLVDAATYFQGQHRDHASLLTATAQGLGLRPTEDPNSYLQTELVQPEVEAITALTGDPAEREKATLTLARSLENAAAETYTETGGVFTTPDLRQAALSIGGIEARHVTVLNVALGDPPVPFALEPTSAAAPPDAYVTA